MDGAALQLIDQTEWLRCDDATANVKTQRVAVAGG